jgi:general secretion pathway protein L
LAKDIVRQTLRIYIDSRWPTPAKTAWVLLAAGGSTLREGTSEPAHWPAADDYEIVLGATQSTWHTAKVPAGKALRGETSRLLAYALEEKLLRDPDSQHFTITRQEGNQVSVLVVARDRLRQVVAQFAALGKPLSRVFSELQCAPASRDAWHLTLDGDAGLLRASELDGVCLDPDRGDGPPPLLAALITGQKASDRAPTLIIHVADGVVEPDAKAWSAALGADVRAGAAYRWHTVPAGAANLLQGEFAPRHRHRAWWARLKPALWLSAAAVIAELLFGIGQIIWQHHRLADAQDHTAQIFQETFPKTPPVDPVAQMRRQLDQLRGPRGLLRSDDALTLLAALADTLGADGRNAVQSLKFDEGVLEVVLLPALAERVAAVSSQLSLRGLIVAAKNDGGSAPKLIIRRGIGP